MFHYEYFVNTVLFCLLQERGPDVKVCQISQITPLSLTSVTG
jgi:hypothetical protein